MTLPHFLSLAVWAWNTSSCSEPHARLNRIYHPFYPHTIIRHHRDLETRLNETFGGGTPIVGVLNWPQSDLHTFVFLHLRLASATCRTLPVPTASLWSTWRPSHHTSNLGIWPFFIVSSITELVWSSGPSKALLFNPRMIHFLHANLRQITVILWNCQLGFKAMSKFPMPFSSIWIGRWEVLGIRPVCLLTVDVILCLKLKLHLH